jgi:cytochrome c
MFKIYTFKPLLIPVFISTCCLLHTSTVLADQGFGLGQSLDARTLSGWDIDIAPSGKGLPTGSGNSIKGAVIYSQKCQSCHGENGMGGSANKLSGGTGSLSSSAPLKSIGSFWPYATTLFDYIRRAMPLNAPQSLGNAEVYALTAYLLNINGIIENSMVLDAISLPKVSMPNVNGFQQVID